jgi:hypothetical protein
MVDVYELVEPSIKKESDYEIIDENSLYDDDFEPSSILSDKTNVVGAFSLFLK